MNNIQKRALEYVENTNGHATRANFIEDHEPIGDRLLEDLNALICENTDGNIILSSLGKAALKES